MTEQKKDPAKPAGGRTNEPGWSNSGAAGSQGGSSQGAPSGQATGAGSAASTSGSPAGAGTAGSGQAASGAPSGQPAAGTTRIRMTRDENAYRTGQTVDLPEAEAQRLVQAGAAELVTPF